MTTQKDKITINDVDDVCLFLLDSKNEYFKMILNRLTSTQKIALKAVIMSEGIELYTKNNLLKLQVTKASLRRISNNPVEFSKEQLEDIEKILDKLEEDEDVQVVFNNIK